MKLLVHKWGCWTKDKTYFTFPAPAFAVPRSQALATHVDIINCGFLWSVMCAGFRLFILQMNIIFSFWVVLWIQIWKVAQVQHTNPKNLWTATCVSESLQSARYSLIKVLKCLKFCYCWFQLWSCCDLHYSLKSCGFHRCLSVLSPESLEGTGMEVWLKYISFWSSACSSSVIASLIKNMSVVVSTFYKLAYFIILS